MAVLDLEGSAKRSLLMRRAQEGDKSSYDSLLREVLPMLKGFVSRRIKSSEDAEEIIQQCLLRIHVYRASFSGEGTFDAWMYTICRNALWDHLKIRKENSHDPLSDDIESRSSESPEQLASFAMRESIQNLSDDAKRALQLTKEDGLEIHEAAKAENISESAMKVRVHRAMKSIRNSLGLD
jgi:RNA polymerase sigma factor (sigma-70 family)